MGHAEICPICKGKGKIRDKETGREKTCHGCNGRGWIVVSNDLPVCYPPLPTPYPYIPRRKRRRELIISFRQHVRFSPYRVR